jgi:anaerobic selenocysteine-containing dehydrogenase
MMNVGTTGGSFMDRRADGIVRSTCTLCSDGCGVLVHMKDGRPVGVEGDPQHQSSEGALCVKGAASLDILDSPRRLTHPLRRAGERGEGKWERISWDEALDAVASGLTTAKEAYGPESVVFVRGGAKGYQDRYLARFANLFGSPNVTATSNICHMPRANAARVTNGYFPMPVYEYPPECIVLWGVNPQATSVAQHRRIARALEAGSRLVVVDVVDTWYTRRAELWVRPRPSSDLALALGVIHVVIEEGLFDAEFVETWTVGFDQLREAVREATPEETELLTWVPAGEVRALARTYAGARRAALDWGNALDGNLNSFQSGRALSILRGLTGNFGLPGGDIDCAPPPVVDPGSPELNAQDAIAPQLRARRIGAEEGVLPIYYSGLPQKTVKAVLNDDPYHVQALYIPGAAMLQSYNDSDEVRRALTQVGFSVAAELFMTPTAEMADIVLPVASYLEADSIHLCAVKPCVSIVQKVAEVGEAWSDLRIYSELSRRMGFGDQFWPSEVAAADYLLAPAGLTFAEFREIGLLPAAKLYRSHEASGFDTPSGKVELYSEQLAEWGFDPVPVFREPPETPFSAPELAERYPLVLTSLKPQQFLHTAFRQIPSLRDAHPDPLVRIHPDTAAGLGVADGDWVWIENERGRVTQRAALTDTLDPRVVVAEPSWWYPEDGGGLHGSERSNLNVLASSDPPYGKEMGSTMLRGYVCRIVPSH